MSSIESEDYEREREALRADPVIKKMAQELVCRAIPVQDVAFPNRTPRYAFMVQALEMYREWSERAGREPIHRHIGGPAQAILDLAYPAEQPPSPS